MKQLFKRVYTYDTAINLYTTQSSNQTYVLVYELQNLLRKSLDDLINDFNDENQFLMNKKFKLKGNVSDKLFDTFGKTPFHRHMLKMADLYELYGYGWGFENEDPINYNPFVRMLEEFILKDELKNTYISTQVAKVFFHKTEFCNILDGITSFHELQNPTRVVHSALDNKLQIFEFKNKMRSNRLFYFKYSDLCNVIGEKFDIINKVLKESFNSHIIAKGLNEYLGLSEDNPETHTQAISLKNYMIRCESGGTSAIKINADDYLVNVEMLVLLKPYISEAFKHADSDIQKCRSIMYDDVKFPEKKFTGIVDFKNWLNLRVKNDYTVVRSNDNLHVVTIKDGKIVETTVPFSWQTFTPQQAYESVIKFIDGEPNKYVHPTKK